MSELISNKIILFSICILLLSLAGLPPFTGFMGKWIVFQELVRNGQGLILLILVLGSFFSLYFYLNFFFSVFLVRSASSLFFSKIKSTFMIFFRSFFVHLRIFGLIMFELFYGIF